MQKATAPRGMRPQKSPVSSGPTGELAVRPDAHTEGMKTPERPLSDYVAEVSERTEVRRGVPLPLGPHETEGGVNFALFSRHASRVRLELFDQPRDATPARVIDLDPERNRTGDVWHVWVEGIRTGQLYAYRMDGPYRPREGHRFNFKKLLLDPFATAISPFPDSDLGLCADMTRLRRSQTWFVRTSMMPEPCRNACLLTITSTGMTTSRSDIPRQG